MSYLKFGLIPVLLSSSLLLQGFQAKPAETKADQAKASKNDDPKLAVLGGTVVDSTTGKPVKDATLLLAGTSGAATPLTTKADENGLFTFKDVRAGTYVLMADHPRYARQTYGSRNGLLGGTLLTILTGQSMSDLSFKLQPNAIASGRVLDEEGEPLQNVMVAALKPMYTRGKRQFLPVGTGASNDLGEFRIQNLAAGRYVLTALFMSASANAPRASGDGPPMVYVPTFYPNVTDSVAAAAVEVAAGRDVGGLDIRMARARAVSIKGQVTGMAKDQKLVVRLIPKGVGLLAMLTGRTANPKPDGAFELPGATRGSYVLRASDQTGMKPLGPGLAIEVGDRPADGLMVDVTPASELNGSVVVKGENKIGVKGARVILESVEGLSIIPPNTTVAEDGTFTLKEVAPEKYLVRLMNGPPNTFVENVVFGNQEVPDDGVLLGGAISAKLEIRLNTGGAQVDGVVHGQDDNPMSGVTVALIPSSRRYLLYQSTFTDQNGTFSFKGITPGEYKVIAWEDVEPNAFQDPEFLKPFESKGETASLKENDRKAITLKAIPRAR